LIVDDKTRDRAFKRYLTFDRVDKNVMIDVFKDIKRKSMIPIWIKIDGKECVIAKLKLQEIMLLRLMAPSVKMFRYHK
jgi:hypothetical protein